MVIERRKYARIEIELPVKYNMEDKPGEPKSAKTLNISAEGLCLLSDEKLEAGKKVTIDLDLVDNKPVVNLKAQVVWSAQREDLHAFANGIKIENIPKSSDKARFLQCYSNKLQEKIAKLQS